jgi:hypothetical protein
VSDNVTKLIVILGLFIGVPVALDLRRRLLLRRKMARMNLPTEQDINADGSQDSQWALRNFLGKTREQITVEWAEHRHCYYEDLYYMGCRAFCFYFPAAVDYVIKTPISAQTDTAAHLCHVAEGRLKYDRPDIREAFSDIRRFADHVLVHYEEFGFADEIYGDLRPRLRWLRQQCAEPGVAPNGGPATQFGSSRAEEGPPPCSHQQ